MPRPKAYDPQQGYRYQILTRMAGEREWEHCDHAKDKQELNQLLDDYRLAYQGGFQFKTITLPQKYWRAV
jgi:hypothetical protein